MDDHMIPGSRRLLPAAMVLSGLLGSVLFVNLDSTVIATLVALSFLVVAGSALELPRGGLIRLYGGVATAAIGLLSPSQAVCSMLLGIGGAGLMRPVKSPITMADVADEALRTVTLFMLARLYTDWLAGSLGQSALIGVTLMICGVVFMFVDLTAYSVVRGGYDMASGLSATSNLVRVLGAGYIAQLSIGVVLVLVYPQLDFFAFAVLVPLMLIMQNTTALLLKVRAAYMRTIEVLAEVAEMQTEGQNGHAKRVSRLATQIGRSLRMGSQQLERLALASLLHDIGRLRVASNTNAVAVAEAGAAVLSRVSFLAALSPIIQKQSLSYRQFMDLREIDGRLARIVRLASDADVLSQASAGPIEAKVLEQLAKDSGQTYDPEVVQALQRVFHSSGAPQ